MTYLQFHLAFIVPVVIATEVNVPAAGVTPPITALLIVPPVKAGVEIVGVLIVGLVSVLLVSVCVPVSVATVESIAIVTAADPL